MPAMAQPGFPEYLALSPDGSTLVFSWAGDLWGVDSGGGAASRLTSHPADETRSAFSRDGTMLAFESNRHGARNLYVMELDGALVAGQPTRITTSDRSQTLAGFSADGEALIFAARQEPAIYKEDRMYRAPLDAGPVERITDAFGAEPSQSADGMAYFFSRSYNPEFRPRYRGPGASDIWRFVPGTGAFKQITTSPANDFSPHVSPDGSLVYISSIDGQNNLRRIPPGATDDDSVALTSFAPSQQQRTIAHGVRDLAVSADGSTAAFVVWNDIYTLDLTDDDAEPQRIDIDVASDSAALDTLRLNLDREADEVAWHPSGKAVAVVARGEILVRSTEEGRPTRRVTDTIWRERDIAWSPDGSTLYFSRDGEDSPGDLYAAKVALTREDVTPKDDAPEEDAPDDAPEDAPDEADGDDDEDEADGDEADGDEADDKPDPGRRWAEAITFDVAPLLTTEHNDRAPNPSPDGRTLLFHRNLGDLMLLDLATMDERPIIESWNEPDAIWAPDSIHVIYEWRDLDFNADIYLQDTRLDDEGNLPAPVNITRHPDIDQSPRLSADGKVLTFLSDRAGENWSFDVYAVYLDDELDGLPGYELDASIEEAAKAAKKRKPIAPVDLDAESDSEAMTFDVDDAYLRIRRITSLPGSESDLALTPGADRIIFSASIDGDNALYSVDHRGRERKTVQSGSVSDVSLSLDGTKVIFNRSGRAATASPTGGSSDDFPTDVDVEIDVAAQQRQKAIEAARTFGATFYHPTLKGLDWPGLSRRYEDLAVKTRTPAAFNRVLNMFWGEVDGSHTGTRGGGGFSAASPANGYFGIDASPTRRGYRVDRVIPGTPADRESSRLEPGDIITAIDTEPLADQRTRAGIVDLHHALAGTSGKETLLTIDRDGQQRYVLITPSSYGADTGARYDHEVDQRRALVEELSDGRLGYLHIRGMNAPSVRDFERDLYAAAAGKEGLVIDVRDNGGGWTTDILLASLTAPAHAYTIPRGADAADVTFDSYPRDRRLIYSWARPINVLINEHSFSNAEIFAHAIKTIGRGTLVGTQTFGGVISTGSFRLIDGTTVRRPFRGWYLPDGTDMEHNGAIPDVPVAQTPADEAAGRDPQLEAAVQELLGRVQGK